MVSNADRLIKSGHYNKVTVSTPGKIFLLGEHVAVYGKPALLASIDKRLYVTVEKLQKSEKKIQFETHSKVVRESLKIFVQNFKGTDLSSIKINITSDLPIGSGLGSSAACAAAVLAGLVKVFKNIWNPQFINEITYKVEKQIHGNPSGADNSTVVFGGLVWYRKEFEFLRSIWNLPTRFYSLPKVILADSGRPSESTKEMVVRVTKLSDRSDFQKILQDQEELVKKILLSLKKDDMFVFKKCLIKGERNLEKLQVVGKKALEIIKNIEKIGGAAKVCGAGGIKSGSGMILCYHQDFRKLVEFMKLKKYSYFQTELAGEGIRLEEKNEN